MKFIATVCLFSTLAVTAAFAQTPGSPNDPASGQPGLNVTRQRCRADIKGQGLKGDSHREAMMACMLKARPDKTARIKCMFDPQTKGLDGDARRAFVKDCVAKANG